MANLKGNDLMALGFPETKAIGIALRIVSNHYHVNEKRDIVLADLKRVLKNPEAFLEDELFRDLADSLIVKPDPFVKELSATSVPVKSYGEGLIEEEAIKQMATAARLPISVRGALMPDGHAGYGLPIGGVLAADNAVIPYGVGVDIGCRMALTIYAMPDNYIQRHATNLQNLLKKETKFGIKEVHERPSDHEIFSRDEFSSIKFVKSLKEKAQAQLGTSGGGNHFVEFGDVEITSDDSPFGLPRGKYMGILSHSGSRGLGARVAEYYTKLAMEKCILPPEAKYLAWLDLNTQEGQEYWLAMNLCGDYASACHHDIHKRLSNAIGEKPMVIIENHHNFAWKEVHDGRELIVHRKGATPAGKGVLGIIPGSMASSAFIVRGRGVAESLHSASHGAGRLMSRTQANNTISKDMVKDLLKEKGVMLIGGGNDEAPMAYKDIHTVMARQTELVDVLGNFFPRVVRMDDGSSDRGWRKKSSDGE